MSIEQFDFGNIQHLLALVFILLFIDDNVVIFCSKQYLVIISYMSWTICVTNGDSYMQHIPNKDVLYGIKYSYRTILAAKHAKLYYYNGL